MEIYDKSHKIFLNACMYANASQFLFNNGLSLQNPEFFTPAIVNEALALELYFKSIYYLEKNKDFMIKGYHSHDFYKLFKELNPETKKDIKNYFKDALTQSRRDQIKEIKSKIGASVSFDLETNLESWSHVFIKVRYIYHYTLRNLSMTFFEEIEKAVLRHIYNVRPEWKKKA